MPDCVKPIVILSILIGGMPAAREFCHAWNVVPASQSSVEGRHGTEDARLLAAVLHKADEVRTAAAVNGASAHAVASLRDLLNSAAQIKSHETRDRALGMLASVQMDVRDRAGAEDTVRRMTGSQLRSDALVLIDLQRAGEVKDPARLAFLKAGLGDLRGALDSLGAMEDDVARSYVLEGIVKKQVQAGNIAGALQLAGAIPDITIRTTTLGTIAWAQTKDNNVAGAITTLHGMRDAISRDRLLVQLVESRARHGDLAGARLLAAEIGDVSRQKFAQRYIDAYAVGPRRGKEQ